MTNRIDEIRARHYKPQCRSDIDYLLTHIDKLEAIRDECDSFALDVLYSAGEMIETKRIRNKAEQIQQRIKESRDE